MKAVGSQIVIEMLRMELGHGGAVSEWPAPHFFPEKIVSSELGKQKAEDDPGLRWLIPRWQIDFQNRRGLNIGILPNHPPSIIIVRM